MMGFGDRQKARRLYARDLIIGLRDSIVPELSPGIERDYVDKQFAVTIDELERMIRDG